ncbi:uncharacterized protein FTOL_09366 [Fusarium torulosum]|uniref:Uncharacterized protein n=1 Tax=Fusarium torulosum TaxID=33205 RepID=A0AAE8MEN3_9HYPO|nr:uncharacterized protein FTOL_09366 [Fusarium torulosum]
MPFGHSILHTRLRMKLSMPLKKTSQLNGSAIPVPAYAAIFRDI